MKELLSTIKNEFPDKAIDISESLQLLKEMVNSTMEDINDKMNIAFENRTIENEIDEEDEKRTIPNYDDFVVDYNIEHSLYESFTHKRPFAFQIRQEKLIEIKTWQEMLARTCEYLIGIDEGKFLNFENSSHMNGKKNKYFSKNPNLLRNPVSIMDKIYIETNLSSNDIRNKIIKMLKEYNIKITDYKVYFRADYTSLNK